MRLLDRYLLREFVVPFAYCLVGFLVFWVSFELFQELSDLQKDQLTFLEILAYYAWKIPELLLTVLPVALLLSLLYALTNHARHHELTAIRAAGIGLWRLSVPYLLVGLVCSVWLFVLSEVWGPRSQEEAERIRRSHQERSSYLSSRLLKNFGVPSTAGRIWIADTYDLDTGDMTKVHVGWKRSDGVRREIVANRGEWVDGGWVFTDVTDTWFSNAPSAFPVRSVVPRLEVEELRESPSQIRSVIKINDLFANPKQAAKRPQLSLREILDYQHFYPNETRFRASLLTQLHGRLAGPFTCLVVVLIAIPFGSMSGRRNAFVGVASSVFICFAYFILLRLGMTLGTGGRLPAWLAAWGPNLLFGGGGLILMSRVR